MSAWGERNGCHAIRCEGLLVSGEDMDTVAACFHVFVEVIKENDVHVCVLGIT